MSTKVQSLVKLVLVFVVSLLSFSVGTYVGFKFSEKKHKLAVVEPSGEHKEAVAQHESESDSHSTSKGHSSSREIASVKDEDAHGDAAPTNDVMTDDEIAKLAEEFVKDDEVPAQKDSHAAADDHGHGAAPTHAPKKSPASVTETVRKHGSEQADLHPPEKATSANHDAAPSQPTTTPSQARVPKSLPPQQAYEPAGKFTVQVSSFAAETEAKQRAMALKNQGYNAFYVPTDIKGKKWFRVSIGLFQNEKEAKSLRESYLKENPDSSAFIQRVPVE